MLHFAFPDGAIGYDCVSCGSRCCKGLGFALSGSELVPLLARAPAIATFLQPQRDLVHALDLEDGCWQLRPDGRCDLEVTHGRAAKPSTCRLFPVNRLMTFGDALVVDLHLTHCPLVDARTDPRTIIRWADVARDLDDVDIIGTTPSLPPGAPADWLTHEAAARDAVPRTPTRIADLVDREATTLLTRWRHWLEVSDAEAIILEAQVAPLLALLVPSLRMQLLTLPGAPPYPHLIRALNAHLTATAWLSMLSTRAGRPPSLRSIAELFRGLPLVRELLIRWNQTVRLIESAAPPSAPPELATAWTQLSSRAATQPFGAALLSVELPTHLRPLLLRLASDRMR